MKILLSIIALITLIFLLGCSAFINNKILNSEIRALGEKYGGIYIFNKKYYDEIEKRETERKEMIKNIKGVDLGDGLYAFDSKPVDNKLPQTLSNGKRYYLHDGDHWLRTKEKRTEVEKIYYDKIYKFIGQDNISKYKPVSNLGYFYVDDDNKTIPIYISISYLIHYKEYGLFGDEGAGFKISQQKTNNVSGGNIFYLEDLEK